MKKTENKRKIRNRLKKNKFNGLCYKNECLCELDTILHCGEMKLECKPFRIKNNGEKEFTQLKELLKGN